MITEKKKVVGGQISQDPLSTKFKIIIGILSFFNPVIAGAVFYYGWKKKLPIKARQANQISLWMFLVFILVVVSIGFFLGK